MDGELLKNGSTIIIIGATIFNLYIVYKNYSTKVPVIDIKLNNLPPYENKNEKTVLKLKNVGNKGTASDFDTTLSCSWLSSMSFKFNPPSKGYRLDPNEEISWKVRLEENFPSSSNIYVEVKDKNRVWELSEQL